MLTPAGKSNVDSISDTVTVGGAVEDSRTHHAHAGYQGTHSIPGTYVMYIVCTYCFTYICIYTYVHTYVRTCIRTYFQTISLTDSLVGSEVINSAAVPLLLSLPLSATSVAVRLAQAGRPGISREELGWGMD